MAVVPKLEIKADTEVVEEQLELVANALTDIGGILRRLAEDLRDVRQGGI